MHPLAGLTEDDGETAARNSEAHSRGHTSEARPGVRFYRMANTQGELVMTMMNEMLRPSCFAGCVPTDDSPPAELDTVLGGLVENCETECSNVF